MRKSFGILFIIMLLFLSTTSVALASGNSSEWDISIQNNNDSIGNGNSNDAAVNSVVVESQKKASEEKTKNLIIESLPKTAQIPSSKASTSFYAFTYRTNDDGGSGVGYSESSWLNLTSMKIGARSELYGSYWAMGQGWVHYTPSTTGNYTLNTQYNITGRILSGSSLNTKVILTDSITGVSEEYTLDNLTSGYYDNNPRSINKTVYMIGGRSYAISFKAQADAGTVLGATMSDFTSQEFDGTQRQVDWNSFTVTKL